MIQYVTYKRVSTAKQGESGLGLASQERDIQLFLANYSGQPYEVVGSFLEVESGGNSNRLELAKAIQLAKKTGATLLVAKLDRLSRKVSEVAQLLDDKNLNFKVASMPNADKFQLHIYAALAEQERDFISKRTKAALAEAKAKGKKLGNNPQNITKMNATRAMNATAEAEKIRSLVAPLVEKGCTLGEIAECLNTAGLSTVRGGLHSPTSVSRIIDRLGITRIT
jgi:DNA invertase Pin-like site-specific DNA recombinase